MRPLLPVLAALTLALIAMTAAANSPPPAPPSPPSLRVATFNASLYAEHAGGLITRLEAGDAKARKIAAIIQQQRPDLLLINEFDYDVDERAAELFQRKYLEVGQDGGCALHYPYRYLAPVNTGVPSGLDLDRNGQLGQDGRARGDDAWGYGLYPGQYGMLVLSRYPIDRAAVRSFQTLRWAALPGAHAPTDPKTGQAWYPAEVWSQLRLSSKSHWDVPVDTPLGRVHFLVAHPTPPIFDGPERRNAHRNYDEIKLWVEYLNAANDHWLCDDQGRCSGLAAEARFVIAGDHNADPIDGNGLPGAMGQLLSHPRLLTLAAPRSDGAAAAAATGVDARHRGPREFDTGAFGAHSGNLRVDYVLPSRGWRVIDSGVFWPLPDLPGAQWLDATDHHLVWVDLQNP